MNVKRIKIYLKGTLDFKLCLGGKNIVLREFYDTLGREMQMTSDPPQRTCSLVALESFVEMQKTTNHCIVYDGGRVHGH